MNKFQHSAHPVLLIGERCVAHYFHTARIICGCMWKSLNMTAKNLQLNPVWPYIPHEMHMLAHYFHTTRSTCGCMWKNVNMNRKKTQSNPVWHYIPHKMHMLAHYCHTTKSTCGCMWKSVNINSKKSTVKSRVALHST